MYRNLTFAILLVITAACSKHKAPKAAVLSTPPPQKQDVPPSPSNPPAPPAPTTTKIPATYTQIMHKQQLESIAKGAMNSQAGVAGMAMGGSYTNNWCAPGVKCDIGVVMVTAGGGKCTGVLVTPRVVLTNRHCVEQIVSKPNTSFAGQSIIVTTPLSAPHVFDGEFQTVVNLIAISPTEFSSDFTKPDYAFLLLMEEMKKTKPVKMNFNGIKNGEPYFIYGVSPFADATDQNAIERRECVAVYETTIAPNLDSPFDTTFKFANCPIGPSNSGSPVFDKHGELVGLMAGQLSQSATTALNLMARDLKLTDENTVLGHIGFGTNLACMPDILNLSKPINPACDIDFSTPRDFVQIAKPLEEQIRASFEPFLAADNKFRYNVQRANEKVSLAKMISQALFLQVPECIQPAELKVLQTQAEMPVELRMAGPRLSKDWKPTDNLNAPAVEKFNLKFDADELKKKGSAEMTIRIFEQIPIHRSILKICAP